MPYLPIHVFLAFLTHEYFEHIEHALLARTNKTNGAIDAFLELTNSDDLPMHLLYSAMEHINFNPCPWPKFIKFKSNRFLPRLGFLMHVALITSYVGVRV